MHALPRALRWYLWGVYLSSLALVIGAVTTAWPLWPQPRVALGWVALFVLLSYVGERTTLRMSGTMSQSLSTPVHIAAVLIFPAPFPVLITLVAVLLTQTLHERKPWYKRAFNICHPILSIGYSRALLSLIARPDTLVQPHHMVGAFPALLLLLVVYYALDVGTLLAVLSLGSGMAPWHVWRENYYPTLLPELAASTIGLLGAVVWRFDEVGLVLVVLPVLALRVALQAITQAEERAATLRRRSQQLEVVLAAGQRLRLQRARADLLRPVAEAARTLVDAAAVAAYIGDVEHPGRLERIVLVPSTAADAGPAYLPRPAAGSDWQMRDIPAAERVLLVPLEAEAADVAGLLLLTGIPPALSHDDRDALGILATQAAIALENAGLHERALALASEDGLTGLLNHRAFQTRLAEEAERAQRHAQPLALLLIDLDDFGAVNNTYGHQVGDATLQSVAAALRMSVRALDIPARYGGDEFAVILPETALAEATTIAHRVLAAIVALSIQGQGVPVHITTSIGVATLPLHARTREELVRAADQAAYAAKHAGKGRVSYPEDAALTLDHNPAVLARQLQHANMTTVEALAAAVDAKDAYTRGHSQRVSTYAVAIATALELSASDIARVRLAGLLHDVGKIGIPDAILAKAGRLTEEEFAVIRQHPEIGERMLAGVPFLHEILPAVRHHHERWDGHGYPDGLAGTAIPPDATILTVADAFDAMTSSRTYRPALSSQEAWRRLQESSGTQFAPAVVAAFGQARVDGLLLIGPEADGAHGLGHVA